VMLGLEPAEVAAIERPRRTNLQHRVPFCEVFVTCDSDYLMNLVANRFPGTKAPSLHGGSDRVQDGMLKTDGRPWAKELAGSARESVETPSSRSRKRAWVRWFRYPIR